MVRMATQEHRDVLNPQRRKVGSIATEVIVEEPSGHLEAATSSSTTMRVHNHGNTQRVGADKSTSIPLEEGMASTRYFPWEAGVKKKADKTYSSSQPRKFSDTLRRRASRLGLPEGFAGYCTRMIHDPEFWFGSLAAGKTRLQFELERVQSTDPRKGYTGFFIPRFDAKEVGEGTLRLDDAPYRALSSKVDPVLVAECDRDEFRRKCSPVSTVSWRDAILWNIRQMAQAIATITSIYKFPVTA